MSHWGIIIAIEVFAVVSILLGILLFLNWQRKKRQTTEVESLLNEFDKTRAERKEWLVQFLKTKYSIAEEPLAEVCEQFIQAEKGFLHYFVKQQFEQTSLVGVYAQLTGLLDDYLKLLPDPPPVIIATPPAVTVIEKQPIVAESQNDFLEVADELPNDPITTAEAGPDWNDAFADVDEFADAEPLTPDSSIPLDILASDPVSATDVTASVDDEEDWNLAFEEADEADKA